MTEKPTRQQLVLAALREKEWVDTATLSSAAVGGTEGLRRLRELKALGYQIEKRRKPNSQQFQYALRGNPPKITVDGTEIVPNLKGAAIAPQHQSFEPYGGPPDAQSHSGRHIADGSDARRAALGGEKPLPFIPWHGDTSRGFTARFRGHNLAVRPFWGDGRWIFVTTKPDGKQESGTAADLHAAKRAAYEATGL